jgi:hypothetical protein
MRPQLCKHDWIHHVYGGLYLIGGLGGLLSLAFFRSQGIAFALRREVLISRTLVVPPLRALQSLEVKLILQLVEELLHTQ